MFNANEVLVFLKQTLRVSFRIRGYSGPHFLAFGRNTDQNNSEYRYILRREIVWCSVFVVH